MIRPAPRHPLRVCYLQYKLEGPGWYWWFAVRGPSYHGPFRNEQQCRKDLGKLVKKTLHKQVAP